MAKQKNISNDQDFNPLETKKNTLDLETEIYNLKKDNLKLRKEIDKLRSKNKPLPPTRMF